MHICYCYHVFYPVKGGVEENIINVSRELIKKGNRVTVVTSNIPNRPNKEFIHGIEVIRTKPLFSIFKTPIMPEYKKLLSTVNADIIMLMEPFLMSPMSQFFMQRKMIFHQS